MQEQKNIKWDFKPNAMEINLVTTKCNEYKRISTSIKQKILAKSKNTLHETVPDNSKQNNI